MGPLMFFLTQHRTLYVKYKEHLIQNMVFIIMQKTQKTVAKPIWEETVQSHKTQGMTGATIRPDNYI